jgi:outer membrane receptor protein involved in Fe transport
MRIRPTFALVSAIGTVGLTLGPAARLSAQEQPAADTPNEVAQVVVTGSRIARPDLDASAPVAILGRSDFDAQGLENFADLAASLPQFAPSFATSRTQSTFSGAAASGLNATNLRNLTPVRTVVLINGRRVPSGSPTSTFVDFNTIPTANIERTEILTGGAAAIYGADAVAGVVNLITRKNFEGIELGGSYGASKEGDNKNPNAYLMVGGRFGNGGSGLLTLEYDRQGSVICADRFLCAEDFAWTSPNAPPVRGPAAYSGVAPAGRFFFPGGNAAGYTQRNGSFTGPNGELIPFSTPTDGFNRNAQRMLAIPTRRVMLAAEGEYELAPAASAFVELNYGSSKTDAPFEGHPFTSDTAGNLFGGAPGTPGVEASIPLNNPFVPQALFDAAVAAGNDPATTAMTWFQRLSGAGGARGATNDRETVRALVGFKGNFDSLAGFGHDWAWEVSHVYGRSSIDSVTRGLVGTDRLFYGLRVEPDPANPGSFRCVDPGARASGCVPINPFQPYTPEMQSYLGVTAGANGRSQLEDSVAFITGSVAELPAGSLQVNVGLERRVFSGFLDLDESINRALVTGNQLGDTDFIETTANEAFVETLVPLLRDKPFAQHLSLEAAYRRSNPSRGDEYGAWKYGFVWSPIEGVRLRAERARTVRAPVPVELSGTIQTFGVVNDPCTVERRNANATRAANCASDGVPASYDPLLIVEQSVAGIIGANPDLDPEQGTTLTYGVVFTPSLIENFSLSVDRFTIDLKGIINTVGRQTKANLCYDTADRLFCDDLTRGTHPTEAGPYVLRSVDDQLLNISETNIAGVDVAADYGFTLANLLRSESELGRISLKAMMTIYDKAEQVPLPGQATVDLLGAAGGSTEDQGYVKRVGMANVGYALQGLSFNWNLRYIGRTAMAPASFLQEGFPKIGSHTYHNIRLGYTWRTQDFFVGINNVFDKQPPFFASGSAGTQALDTVPAYYDIFGRSFYGGFRARF